MRLQVKGRHVDVTDSLFQYAEKKLGKLARHLSDESRCELELIVEHNPSISDSQVAEKLERQVKRYREKRTRRQAEHMAHHHTHQPDPASVATLPEEDEAMIVKTKQFNMKPMSDEEALLQLELIGHDFFVFVNAESDEVNVIYKRRDGNYGLIEPTRA
jgi:putative sigma-54 modulation protein